MEMDKMFNPMCMGSSCGGPTMGMGWGMGHGMAKRKYYTKKEKADWLEAEIKDAEKELAGMKEKLADLKK